MKAPGKFYNTFLLTFKIFFLFSALVFFLNSCVKTQEPEPELQSAINVVNATVGLPAVIYAINGVRVEGPALKYNEESKYFITFPGKRKFDFTFEGQTGLTLAAMFELKQNTYHSIFVSGVNTSITTLLTTDDLTNPQMGKAKIRFIHLTSDAEQLMLVAKSGSMLFPAQAYNTSSEFIQLDPGVYNLQLKTAAGTAVSEANATFASGKIYNIWAKGLKSGAGNTVCGIQVGLIN